MNKSVLEEYIANGESTHSIAQKENCGQTNVRYWLRKHGLNTTAYPNSQPNVENGRLCKKCSGNLTGKQRFWCSEDCKDNQNPNTVARQKRVSMERKTLLIEMSGGCCSECGYKKNIAALQFHHLHPQNKTFNIDARKLSNTRWSSILEEWKKCVLLCSNCHIELHNPRLEWALLFP